MRWVFFFILPPEVLRHQLTDPYGVPRQVTSLGSDLTALVLECREELLSTAQRPPGSPAIDTYQIAKTYSDKIEIA